MLVSWGDKEQFSLHPRGTDWEHYPEYDSDVAPLLCRDLTNVPSISACAGQVGRGGGEGGQPLEGSVLS